MSRVYHTTGGDGGATAARQLYFCHECNRTVSISPSLPELVCPNCNSGFLEEFENPNPNSIPSNPFLQFGDDVAAPFSFTTSRSGGGGGGGGGDLMDFSALFGGPIGAISRPVSGSNSDEFNPFAFLQNYLSTLHEGGANIQFVIENDSDGVGGGRGFGGGFGGGSSLGDYFIGPGLEQLIQHLAENDPNRYGTPPASKTAVEKLPTVKISKEIMESDYSDCAVCKDSFDLDEEAKQLPCKHMYHSECILPWLELHNSCPVCRFELPTDDQEYENRSREGGGSRGSGGVGLGAVAASGGSQENPATPRTTLERRFRINLPWPFAGYNSSAETSNSGARNNSSGDGNQGSGGQARQEDLD